MHKDIHCAWNPQIYFVICTPNPRFFFPICTPNPQIFGKDAPWNVSTIRMCVILVLMEYAL